MWRPERVFVYSRINENEGHGGRNARTNDCSIRGTRMGSFRNGYSTRYLSMRRGPKQMPIPGKKWNEKFVHENKTWHVVHKLDKVVYAVAEVKPGICGGAVERFYI